MKSSAIILSAVVLLLLSSCADIPTAEEMKAEQEAYEKEKQEQILAQSKFFESNKAELYKRAELIGRWCADPYGEEDVNSDSSYYHAEKIDLQSFPLDQYSSYSTSEEEALTAWFFVGKDGLGDGQLFINRLRACDTTGVDAGCLTMDQRGLQMLLDLEYVFIDNEIIYQSPITTAGSSTFEGGYSFNSIHCFNVATESSFYRSSIVAENSDEVSYTENTYGGSSDFSSNLQADLKRNALKARDQFVSDHFNY